jgi:hypothetical protein
MDENSGAGRASGVDGDSQSLREDKAWHKPFMTSGFPSGFRNCLRNIIPFAHVPVHAKQFDALPPFVYHRPQHE